MINSIFYFVIGRYVTEIYLIVIRVAFHRFDYEKRLLGGAAAGTIIVSSDNSELYDYSDL